MEHAYNSIRGGHCNAAIVGGCNLCLHPYVSLQFSRLGVLSPQGMCKAFDRDGKYSDCMILLKMNLVNEQCLNLAPEPMVSSEPIQSCLQVYQEQGFIIWYTVLSKLDAI
jgi:hypothetical protein